PETTVAKPVELFGIRKASLDGLVSQPVQVLARSASAIGANPFLAVLPHMPRNHFCLVLRPRACLEHGALGTVCRIGLVVAESLTVCRAVGELMLLWANVHVLLGIVFESPLGDQSLCRRVGS